MKTLLTILILATLAHANSIGPVFALQQPASTAPSYANSTNVELGNGIPLVTTTLLKPGWFALGTPAYLAFFTAFPAADGQLVMTLTLGGVTYATGATLADADSCVSSFVLPRGFYHPYPATLTVTMDGESREYEFEFVEPVPEPSTLALMLAGGVFVIWRGRTVNPAPAKELER